MSIWKQANPLRAVRDLVGYSIANRGQNLVPLALALFFPALILGLFIVHADAAGEQEVTQEIIYFESWTQERSAEEILRDRWAIQCQKDARDEQIKAGYRALGRATGIDVDKIDREAAANKPTRKNLPGQEYAQC